MLNISYKNSRGTAQLCGGASPFRLTHILGLGLPESEYITASYSGYDGQETLAAAYLPRSITLSGDIVSHNLRSDLAGLIDILSVPGYLYIQSEDIYRRIYCNQITFPDAERILRGKICTFAIQLVCDNPFFEGAESISVPLYRRTKELTTQFTLPSPFGITVAEAVITPQSRNSIEPKIRIICPSDITQATQIKLENTATDKKLELSYTLSAGEEIVIDVKERTVTSSQNGNIINCISDDTYLGHFTLEPLVNTISAYIDNVNAGIVIECVYNDCFVEAFAV